MKRAIAHLDAALAEALKQTLAAASHVSDTLKGKVDILGPGHGWDVQLSHDEIEYILDQLPAPTPEVDPSARALRSHLTSLMHAA